MDKTSICNQALVECEVDATISSVDTDTSVEAQRMRRLYDTTKEECLSVTDWAFATKYLYLSNVERPVDCPYSYAFNYPSSVLRFEGVYDNEQSVKDNDISLDFVVGTNIDGSQKFVYCDSETPLAKVVLNIKDETLPQFFCKYLYLALAFRYSKIAGASNDVKQRLYAEMGEALAEAKELNAQASNNILFDTDNYYVDVRS